MSYFGARYYDSKKGRWLARDEAEQFFNNYNAFGNNPLSNIDPDGKITVKFVGGTLFVLGILKNCTVGGLTAVNSSKIKNMNSGQKPMTGWETTKTFTYGSVGGIVGGVPDYFGIPGGTITASVTADMTAQYLNYRFSDLVVNGKDKRTGKVAMSPVEFHASQDYDAFSTFIAGAIGVSSMTFGWWVSSPAGQMAFDITFESIVSGGLGYVENWFYAKQQTSSGINLTLNINKELSNYTNPNIENM